MKLGKIKILIFCIMFFFQNSILVAENKILSTPLINLDELKPSFEEIEETTNLKPTENIIKNKKKSSSSNNSASVKLIGLDKITAKTSELVINLGETKRFGPLEIKVLKCAKLNGEKLNDDSIAYLQVKDLSKNDDEKVFIFNGWTFSSDPTLAPFDHAIYDLQLVNCNMV